MIVVIFLQNYIFLLICANFLKKYLAKSVFFITFADKLKSNYCHMKKILTFVLLAASVFVMGQKKIAIYVTETKDAEEGVSELLGSSLVDAITNSGQYIAIERTASFLSAMQREQMYQRSGSVDDGQIRSIGKMMGVNYVCVASMKKVFGSETYLAAHVIDVERATVVAAANSNRIITNNTQMYSAFDDLSAKLLKEMAVRRSTSAKKVAVYVTRTGNKDIDIILGDQLVAGFTTSKNYLAIERSNSFLAELSKEQDFQENGPVDVNQLCALGRQFGVQYVCVAKTVRSYGNYNITTRIIDVESGAIVNSHVIRDRNIGSISTTLAVAKEIVDKVSGLTVQEQKQAEAKAQEEERQRQLALQRQQEQERQQQERAKQERLQQAMWNGYVDLGLPSGKLWKVSSTNYATWYSCSGGGKLPSSSEWAELKRNCTLRWEGTGYSVIGRNGNRIFLPINGYIPDGKSSTYKVGGGYYWTSTRGEFISFDNAGFYISYRTTGPNDKLSCCWIYY